MWILLAMIALMPLEKNPYLRLSESFLGIIPDFTMIKLLGVIGLGWSMVEVLEGRVRLRLFESRQARAFFWFLLAVGVATIVSGAGLVPLTRVLAIVLFLPVALAAVRTERDLRLALQVSVVAMVLIFPYAYRQTMRFGGRLGVGLYEPNYLALALVLLLPLAYVFARQATTGWRRLCWMAGMGVLLIALVLTGSRGGFVGLLVVLPLLACGLMKHRLLALGGIAGLLLLTFAFPTTLGHRLRASGLDQRVEDVGAQVSQEARLQILEAGLKMIQANPLTGVGLGNFKPSVLAYGAPADKIAHNTYLEVAAELGLPALAAFLWLLYVTFVSLGRSGRQALRAGRPDLARLTLAIRIGLTGYLVSAMFLSAQFEKFFWLVIFLSISLERVVTDLARRAETEEAPEPILEAPPAWAGERR